ncbi:UNVERIFIED_CONTAM: hypothetical protein Slati_1439300 [Sesamum latifolium]|uniref:Uncharacterized protein n=1 Tax=Sesamum latifolium TaxID=2727402 RepID=A0AAW2X6H4_9LAMI
MPNLPLYKETFPQVPSSLIFPPEAELPSTEEHHGPGVDSAHREAAAELTRPRRGGKSSAMEGGAASSGCCSRPQSDRMGLFSITRRSVWWFSAMQWVAETSSEVAAFCEVASGGSPQRLDETQWEGAQWTRKAEGIRMVVVRNGNSYR